MADNYVALRIRATDEARPDLDDLKLKLDELKGRVAEARAEVTTAEADAKLTDLEAKLEAVGKKVERPSIDMAGATRANAQITAVEADLDGLDRKAVESAAVQKKAAEDAAAAQEGAAAKSRESAGLMAGAGDKVKMALLGVGVGAAAAVYEAGKFQDQTVHLVTDAGESAKNLGMVQQGILAVSAATGTSAADITNAMYHIESGGYHGAAGLKLLKIAAEGAKVGGADLDTVSKTLVGTMNAYGLSASHSASFMNQLIATVGAGDMRMQDLASSLSSVAPLAAAAHISFSQVGGAIATMTAQGMSAQQSTQDLANTIRSLSNPNNVAIGEMQALGLNSQDVAKHLGERGLTGTISLLTRAITEHMGKSGMVLQSAFQNATNAAKDANIMIAAMPSHLQELAKGFLSGSISSKAWKADLQGLDPVQAHLMSQFAGTAEKAHSFNNLLSAGSPAAQTYTAALAKMMGGATGLNTALMLSGSRQAVFAANSAAIAAAAAKGGDQVANWSTIQDTFNFKLEQAKASVMDMGISLGSALLPAVTAVVGPIAHMMAVIASNKAASIALAAVIGGVLAGALGLKLAKGLKDAAEGIKAAGEGVEWLIKKLFRQKAASEGAAAAAKKSAGEEAAASKESAAAAEEAAGAEETAAGEAAAANDEAAAESSGSWLAAAGRQIAAAGTWVGEMAVKVAAVVASSVAGAATTAASWVAAGAQQVAGAAVWVAQTVAKVAVIVASNVAGAAVTMAAWVAANAVMLLGIGLIVVAVAAAVYEIVKHWKAIVHGVEEAWDAVFGAVSKAVSKVIDFVKSHWQLLLAILLGPIALAVLEIAKHWRLILHDAEAFAHDVTSTVSRLAHDVAHWFEAMVDWAVGRFLSGFPRILGLVRQLFSDWISIQVRGVEAIVRLFEDLGKRAVAVVLGIGGDLERAGLRIIEMLANGIMSGASAATHAISSVVDEVKSFLPFSPAKKGPLSGSGSPDNSGRSIGRQVAGGIAEMRAEAAAAAAGLARAIASGNPAMIAAARALTGQVTGQYRHMWHDLHEEHLRHLADLGIGSASASGAVAPAGGYGAAGQLEIVVRIETTEGQIINAIGDGMKLYVREKGGGGPHSAQRALGRTWPAG